MEEYDTWLQWEIGLQKSVVERNPHLVILDIPRRTEIWRDQILPDRFEQIQQAGRIEYLSRMYDLLDDDLARLTRTGIEPEIVEIYKVERDKYDEEFLRLEKKEAETGAHIR